MWAAGRMAGPTAKGCEEVCLGKFASRSFLADSALANLWCFWAALQDWVADCGTVYYLQSLRCSIVRLSDIVDAHSATKAGSAVGQMLRRCVGFGFVAVASSGAVSPSLGLACQGTTEHSLAVGASWRLGLCQLGCLRVSRPAVFETIAMQVRVRGGFSRMASSAIDADLDWHITECFIAASSSGTLVEGIGAGSRCTLGRLKVCGMRCRIFLWG